MYCESRFFLFQLIHTCVRDRCEYSTFNLEKLNVHQRNETRRASVNRIRLDWNRRNRYDRAYAACGYFNTRTKKSKLISTLTLFIVSYSIIMCDAQFNSLNIIQNFCSLISVQIRLIYRKKYEKLQFNCKKVFMGVCMNHRVLGGRFVAYILQFLFQAFFCFWYNWLHRCAKISLKHINSG